MNAVKIEQDVGDGMFYVRERVKTLWKAKSRHGTMCGALRSLLKECENQTGEPHDTKQTISVANGSST